LDFISKLDFEIIFAKFTKQSFSHIEIIKTFH